MPNLEDKKIKIIVILVALIGFLIYYFYPKDEYVMEMVKPTRPTIQKVEEIKELNKKEIFVTPKVEEKKEKEDIVEEKQIIKRGNVLFTEIDPSGRYTV